MKNLVKIALCIGVAGSLALVAPPLVAQEPTSPVYERETTLTFDPEEIDGSVESPDGALIGGQQSRRHSSLIRVRTGFSAELVKSVESL